VGSRVSKAEAFVTRLTIETTVATPLNEHGAQMVRMILNFLGDQRIRFLMVGATNTAVGYGLFAALTHWVFAEVFLGYLISLVLSYVVGIGLAFILYRRFVFVVKGRVLGDLTRFVSVYLVSIAVNLIALPLLVEVVHIPPLASQAIILVVTTVVSFLGHKNFSFRRDPAESPTSEPNIGLPS
jgi:putative flippase GtrA